MGNIQPLPPSPIHRLPGPMMSEILDILPEKERFQAKRVSRQFHDVELLDTKVAFIHKAYEQYYEGYKVYFPGYRIYFVDSWALITQIISTMHRIKHLALVYCDFDDYRFTMTIYTKRNLQKITSLKLYHTYDIPEFRGQRPLHVFDRLTCIDRRLLLYPMSLTEFVYNADAVPDATQEMCEAVIVSNPNLQRLALSYRDRLRLEIPERPLRCIKFCSISGISAEVWQSVIDCCRDTLEQFICRFHPMADVAIPEAHEEIWWTQYPNLRDIRLGNLRGWLADDAFNFPMLEVFAISYAPLLQNAPTAEEMFYTFQHLNRLKILDIALTFIQQASLETIANCCPLLEILVLRKSFHLTDEGVTQIVRLQRLQQLSIVGQITDQQMARCAKYLPDLQVICSMPPQSLNYQTFMVMASKARRSQRKFFVWAPNVPSEWGPNNLFKINESLLLYLTSSIIAPHDTDYFMWKNITSEQFNLPTHIIT